MKCENCNVQLNENNKFCPECGNKINIEDNTIITNEKKILDKQISPSTKNEKDTSSDVKYHDDCMTDNINEDFKLAWWMILIFPVIQTILYFKFWANIEKDEYGNNITQSMQYAIAEALVGAVVIIAIPLIIVGIIFLTQKIRKASYNNALKHSFIGATIMLIFVILSQINHEQDLISEQENREKLKIEKEEYIKSCSIDEYNIDIHTKEHIYDFLGNTELISNGMITITGTTNCSDATKIKIKLYDGYEGYYANKVFLEAQTVPISDGSFSMNFFSGKSKYKTTNGKNEYHIDSKFDYR